MYERMRRETFVLHEPSADAWLVLDYAGVKRALYDADTFSSRASPAGGPPLHWLIFHDPPGHTKLGGIVARAFTPRVVANLEPRIRELSRELLDATIARGTMDVAVDYAIPLPLMVIAELIGVPIEDRPLFRGWSDVV